ncbi:MAG TPA: penicillin-binding protein activator [Xanthobacteraceae bacterium]|nr:penicillin-binding protein activator [Xanthobacteraceae bacterium]
MALRLDWARPVIRRRRFGAGLAAAALAGALAACTGTPLPFGQSPTTARQPSTAIGTGNVRAGLILPLSGAGNAGPVAQSMRNAAELALSDFNTPNVQLLIKDDGGNAFGAQAGAEATLQEGAEIILGPLFGPTVAPVGQVARARNIPVIAFSTDSSVAARGVYLLSFLPESDVDRVVDYAASRGKRSFAALIPENAYGNVVDAAFRQAVARNGGRIVANERFGGDAAQIQEAVGRVAPALAQADTLFIPGDSETVPLVGQALANAGVNTRRLQLLGTGLWDDERVFTESTLQGAWFAAPESSGFRSFSTHYRARYGQPPLRAATLAYDAVSLVAALVKTQGPQRFGDEVLTSSSGFSGVDGIFRFKPDGTNERGLAVMRVTPSGAQTVSPAPKAFPGSAT